MAIDGIYLHFLKEELAAFMIGARVEKVYQPTRLEAVLLLRTRSEQRKLFLSASGNYPRVHFTTHAVENPQKPPMFCMLLRKHLTGALVRAVTQVGHDRILRFDFDATNEIGDPVRRSLVIEIMAQYSNIILLDEEEKIIDAVKRVDETKSSVREVLPKVHYCLPPAQNKLSFERDSAQAMTNAILEKKQKQLSGAVLSVIEGVSPLLAGELAYRVTLDDPLVGELNAGNANRLLTELQELQSRIENACGEPFYYVDSQGQIAEFSYMPLTKAGYGKATEKAASFSEVLDRCYFGRERYCRAKAKAEDLFKLVATLNERTARKLLAQREELQACADKETKRVFAELINANLFALEKGALFYEVPNYYDDYKTVRIPVQPQLSPAENAQRYYKEYRKAHTAEKMLAEWIEKGEDELRYLQTVEDELSRAETERELAEIRTELREVGFVKKQGADKKKSQPLPPLSFSSPNGFRVFVGRNNLQNDRLTFKTAAKNDFWFHAKKAPGSHVILSLEGQPALAEDMEYAAAVAAWFSSVREKGSVEVDYTPVKNIKKPPAANPGFVIYHVYKTMLVNAAEPVEEGERI